MSLTIFIKYALFVVHKGDKWVFGRESMKLHNSSFYENKGSKFRIDIGDSEVKERESIDVGKETEFDSSEQSGRKIHIGMLMSKDYKSHKEQPQRSADVQDNRTQLGWRDIIVVDLE